MLRPSMFVLHVPAVLTVVAAVLLGNWQIGAWQMHREDRAAEIADAAPIPLADVLGPDDAFPGDGIGQPVTLTGRWLPDAAVFIADRSHEDQDGYWLVVPFLACGTPDQGPGNGCAGGSARDSAIPVVVGWSETTDGVPPAPTGDADLVGWLQPGEAAAGPDADPDDRVLPALRIADLLQRVDEDLYGGFVILRTARPADAAAAPGALAAVTPDSLPEPPSSTALRNLLYGIEWWLFAGFAVFLWWRWTRDEVIAARVSSADEDVDVTPVSDGVGDGSVAPDARIPSEP